jgi:hypothetical protein
VPFEPEPETSEPGPDDVLRQELARLLDAGGAPDAADALDALWIARLSGLDPVDWSLLGNGTDPTAPSPSKEQPPPQAPAYDDPAPATAADRPSARLHLPGGTDRTAPTRPGGAHAIRVAQPRALPDTLALTRALRPLRQTTPSPRARVLDVEATAAASGDTELLVPILRPAAEPRFSVDLLIDTGTTMTVWHRLADELRTLLARHGAFADVRAWALDTDGPEPTLAPFRRGARTTAPTRRWQQPLADPTGRRVVLVLTDGVGPSWYGGELFETLADWSVRRPVAALQVLPGRLWHRTALRTAPVRARGTESDRPTIEVRPSGPLPGIARGRAGARDRARIRWLPVLEVSGDWLAPWARLVSGRTTDWVPLRAAALTEVLRPTSPAGVAEPDTPAAWIERFEEGYSPEAFRLLRLLAAAPLSLPVMRLVQRTMLPESTPMHLAEIFLSGLLVRRSPSSGPGEDPDTVLYDFRDGVRDALLERLSRSESLRVLEQVIEGVSERVAATFGGVSDFGALLAAVGEGGVPDGRELPAGSRAFAEVAWAVIAGVGGDHAELVAKLTRGRVPAAVPVPEPEPEPEPREVAEEPEERRERRPGLLSWLRRRMPEAAGRGEENAVAVGDDPVVSVPSRIPELPAFYVRGSETADVLAMLRRGPGTCVIKGEEGVGKSALAADCARKLAEDVKMVRWIRAESRESLLADLAEFADDLGFLYVDIGDVVPTALLAALSRYLMQNPGWLLIYDGVTPETFTLGPEDPEAASALFLPPSGYGSLLVTLAEGARWRLPHESITLRNLSRESAVDFLAEALAVHRGALWHDEAELGRLVDVTDTNPRVLSRVVSRFGRGPWPVGDPIQDMLLSRAEVARFMRSLVWITENGTFVGTGVAIAHNTVLTGAFPLESTINSIYVHRQNGPPLPMRRWVMRAEDPGLSWLEVTEGSFPAAIAARAEDHAVVGVWWEVGKSEERSPQLLVGHADSDSYPPPRGAVLLDADGRLRSIVAESTEGAVKVDVLRSLKARDREPAPMPSEAPPQGPLFFLSYARTPTPTGARYKPASEVGEFFTLLTQYLRELTTWEGKIGFFDQDVRVGTDWQQEMLNNLAGARVFVPLYTPRYFASAWCRKEWNVFQWRRQLTLDDKPKIVPVLWTPIDRMQLPPEAAEIAFADDEFGRGYTQQGLHGLRLSGRHAEYRRTVWQIAEEIAREAVIYSRRPGPDRALLDGMRRAFEAEEP